MVSVLEEFIQKPLQKSYLLNVGGSAGIIDNFLADHFCTVFSIDIDEAAINKARMSFPKDNLEFQVGDALNLKFDDGSFDVVICSQVYEHVPSAEKMMDEIFRVLVPGGICYFAANNRLMWNEPHYNLPLLSVVPRPLAHLYIKVTGKADHYHELHYSYWGLRKLVKRFVLHDYTRTIIHNPLSYHVDYMVKPESIKAAVGRFIVDELPWLSPGYIWLLEKPGEAPCSDGNSD
ncbi:class I SAM-dependent methyltransferase [Candidatus Entotheonella palauensis]|uniref:Methyltransferase type 11 domain-containing protein n=1 Tax=Candidatus Entotheonella gemina TaxID=1429439 RepID=W4MFL9_9BACT|nr:class I SAM-dependent methyltransferase [Candidatus Entotheonella palauensis]ETX08975.1 MAG: hypothetical protein ETSY2_02195 [Candidatus Entotheonella gemina]